jgi:hypothetical protein
VTYADLTHFKVALFESSGLPFRWQLPNDALIAALLDTIASGLKWNKHSLQLQTLAAPPSSVLGCIVLPGPTLEPIQTNKPSPWMLGDSMTLLVKMNQSAPSATHCAVLTASLPDVLSLLLKRLATRKLNIMRLHQYCEPLAESILKIVRNSCNSTLLQQYRHVQAHDDDQEPNTGQQLATLMWNSAIVDHQ